MPGHFRSLVAGFNLHREPFLAGFQKPPNVLRVHWLTKMSDAASFERTTYFGI
jgi:hypothetical protein